jgi:hypothetical protein
MHAYIYVYIINVLLGEFKRALARAVLNSSKSEVRIHAYIHTYLHTYIQLCVYICKYIHTYTCDSCLETKACMCVLVCAYVCERSHPLTHAAEWNAENNSVSFFLHVYNCLRSRTVCLMLWFLFACVLLSACMYNYWHACMLCLILPMHACRACAILC